jgi:hypothetical protein
MQPSSRRGPFLFAFVLATSVTLVTSSAAVTAQPQPNGAQVTRTQGGISSAPLPDGVARQPITDYSGKIVGENIVIPKNHPQAQEVLDRLLG